MLAPKTQNSVIIESINSVLSFGSRIQNVFLSFFNEHILRHEPGGLHITSLHLGSGSGREFNIKICFIINKTFFSRSK